MLIPVILCGGSGTRLWPLSRRNFPKQLMPMLGGRQSLLQATIRRASSLPNIAPPIVVTNEQYRFIVASQLQEIGTHGATIILESEGRNTAPAVAVAALAALSQAPESELLVLPADHSILDLTAFQHAIDLGRPASQKGRLVTFGIVPDNAETGYGYIKKALPSSEGCPGTFSVEQFIEKPDMSTAQHFLEDDHYFWNSGMFLFQTATVLTEFENKAPQILAACREAFDRSRRDLDFLRLEATAFCSCPSDSLDYAIMEKTNKGTVVPLQCGWRDLGSWSSLYDQHEKDSDGNVCVGDVVAQNSHGCYLHSSSRLLATYHLDNIAIVETKDAILAAPLNEVHNIKSLIGMLDQDSRTEIESHSKVFRPWGNYEGIDIGERYQVKRIIVYPGQTLSLQKHYHRSEHWVIVKGTAIVTKNTDELLLTENESIYIPLGTIHRLHNPGKVNLELIEIQTGSYVGEDDIVRLEDIYGREKW